MTTTTIPDGAVRIRIPVLGVEGLDTSDRRHIRAGALSTRALPLPLYGQTRATHGDTGDAASWHVGAITHLTRVPGNTVNRISTGTYFPPDTNVWVGEGWIYRDVPAAPEKSIYSLVRDGALRGISMDLSAVDATMVIDTAADGSEVERVELSSGSIAAATLVGQPAFPDAYITLTDDPAPALVAAATPVTAGGVPSWRAFELGDQCGPCAATDGDSLGMVATMSDNAATDPAIYGDDYAPPTPDYSTSGMVALIPANPGMLTVDGGDPEHELHLTLAYLGDQVDTWDPDLKTAVLDAGERIAAQARAYTGNIFSHAVFNPNGDGGRTPAAVYLLDGTEDRPDLDALHTLVTREFGSLLGPDWPAQHTPWVPHITAGYGPPPGALAYTGRVPFDRLRVAVGDMYMDYALGGGLVASATTDLPPAHIYAQPTLTGPTPLTFGEDSGHTTVHGHIATWGTCHTGITGRCVTPPRSPTGYAYYLVHAARARDKGGTVVTIPVGYGTVGTGHADLRMGAQDTTAHYDNTGTAAFEWTCGEDDWGIWVAGRLLPDLDDSTRLRAMGTVISGDWRPIRGGLELVAALGVNTPGFPVPRARVASGMPLALVAAGTLPAPRPPDDPTTRARESTRAINAQALVNLSNGTLTQDDALKLTELTTGALALAADRAAAVAAWDDSNGDGTDQATANADWLLSEEGDHPWFSGELLGDTDMREVAGMFADMGHHDYAAMYATLHLPPYIKRIARHLQKEGMDESRAIATAVNAAKKMCETGDTSFPGRQQINPGSRAQACAAVAQWKKDRPGAR